jgi:hypothetical protein
MGKKLSATTEASMRSIPASRPPERIRKPGDGTRLPAPERSCFPSGPKVATLLERPLSGGWRRTPIDARRVDAERAKGRPIFATFLEIEDIDAHLETGLVVLDGVGR